MKNVGLFLVVTVNSRTLWNYTTNVQKGFRERKINFDCLNDVMLKVIVVLVKPRWYSNSVGRPTTVTGRRAGNGPTLGIPSRRRKPQHVPSIFLK